MTGAGGQGRTNSTCRVYIAGAQVLPHTQHQHPNMRKTMHRAASASVCTVFVVVVTTSTSAWEKNGKKIMVRPKETYARATFRPFLAEFVNFYLHTYNPAASGTTHPLVTAGAG